MRCYYQNIYNLETQEYETFYSNHQYRHGETMFIKCGSCFDCKKMKAIEWVNKAKLEMKSWKYAYFITLTYKNAPNSLEVSDYQKFIKRFRRHIDYYYKEKLSYLLAGEYGEKKSRAHYHGIFFMNLDLSKTFFKVGTSRKKRGAPLYSSTLIEKLWGHGFITIAPATIETIAYTTLYSTKKLNKKQHYTFLMKSKNGEYIKPEFIVASNKFGQKHVKENLEYFKEHWKLLPTSILKSKLFDEDFQNDIKEQKQYYIYKKYMFEDWKKLRFENFKKQKNMYDLMERKRLLE